MHRDPRHGYMRVKMCTLHSCVSGDSVDTFFIGYQGQILCDE
jgi:hypothetical protein